MKNFRILALLAGLLMFSGLAYAGTCDLTPAPLQECTINTAIFQGVDPQSTGTGVIDPFVQVHPGGNDTIESAYNTTVDKTLDVGAPDNFNHELLLSDLKVETIGGITYYKFILDINEDKNAADRYLSLDDVQLFQSTIANQSVETFSGGVVDIDGTLVYRLDTANVDNVVLLDYSFDNGSGSGDMSMFIPVSAFNGEGQYVYLYSQFGVTGLVGSGCSEHPVEQPCRNYGSSDGFEEWINAGGTPVPEPATMVLLGTGLLGIAGKVRRRMKKS